MGFQGTRGRRTGDGRHGAGDRAAARTTPAVDRQRYGIVWRVSTLQTLDRGLRALEFVSRAPNGVTVNAIAEHLGVHRTIAYRIVSTLHDHHLVTRTHTGVVRLGAFAATLSRRFAPQLLHAGRPVLRELVDATGVTSFLSVAEDDECVVVLVEEARRGEHGLRVSYQEGTRHPIHRGAPGLAILAMRPSTPHDPVGVERARADGYSITHGELQAGAVGVSVGVSGAAMLDMLDIEASVGVVALGDLDIETAARASKRAAQQLVDVLAG